MASRVDNFRVVIVGAGFAGLTLAKALEAAGIDYVLLESKLGETEEHGAGLAISAAANRILEQLGCLDDIREHSSELLTVSQHYKDGSRVMPSLDWGSLMKARTSYAMLLLERRLLPEILRAHMKQPERLINHKKVTKLEMRDDGVIVHCNDGTTYSGDIVVGADGIRSRVRAEMYKLADSEDPTLRLSEQVEKNITAEYKCVYGISRDVSGLEKGPFYWVYNLGSCILNVQIKNGLSCWQLNEKLDRVYKYSEIPRFTDDDAKDMMDRYSHYIVTEDGSITAKNLFDDVIRYKCLALEEGYLNKWTHGRIALLGDAVHKVTPNAGSGANMAIESAAALANAINDLVVHSSTTHPTAKEVEAALTSYQEKRSIRAQHGTKRANFLLRVHNMSSMLIRAVIRLAAFQNTIDDTNDWLLDTTANTAMGAEWLHYLPLPPRTFNTHTPFNPDYPEKIVESRLKRALLATPFLVLSYLAAKTMLAKGLPIEDMTRMAQAGQIVWEGGHQQVRRSVFGVKAVDDLFSTITVFFTPSIFSIDEISWYQCFSFLMDAGTLYSILLVEYARRSNIFKSASFLVIWFMLAQLRGAGIILPVYYFIHWIQSPYAVFQNLDRRLTDLRFTRTIVLVLLLALYAPMITAFTAPSLAMRWTAALIWQPFPIYIYILQHLCARFQTKTIKEDRWRDPLRDLHAVYLSVGMPAAFSAVIWLWTYLTAPYPLTTLYVPVDLLDPAATFMPTLSTLARRFLQYDELFVFGSTFLWLAYCFWDLRHAGMFPEGWTAFVAAAAAMTMCAGPGAAVGSLFLWREWLLAHRRHRSAIVGPVEVKMRYAEKIAQETGDRKRVEMENESGGVREGQGDWDTLGGKQEHADGDAAMEVTR